MIKEHCQHFENLNYLILPNFIFYSISWRMYRWLIAQPTYEVNRSHRVEARQAEQWTGREICLWVTFFLIYFCVLGESHWRQAFVSFSYPTSPTLKLSSPLWNMPKQHLWHKLTWTASEQCSRLNHPSDAFPNILFNSANNPIMVIQSISPLPPLKLGRREN